MITELTVFYLFWVNLYVFGIDTIFNMTTKRIFEKLYFDVWVDVGNYDHWLPLLMMVIEYFITNIEFTYKGYKFVFMGTMVYITY